VDETHETKYDQQLAEVQSSLLVALVRVAQALALGEPS
jgi:hypothetical protein